MNQHSIFKPHHPAVSVQMRSRLLWAEMNPGYRGGLACSMKWYKFRFTAKNDSAMIAQITFDFQNKN